MARETARTGLRSPDLGPPELRIEPALDHEVELAHGRAKEEVEKAIAERLRREGAGTEDEDVRL
jgi:hypothetical protein